MLQTPRRAESPAMPPPTIDDRHAERVVFAGCRHAARSRSPWPRRAAVVDEAAGDARDRLLSDRPTSAALEKQSRAGVCFSG